MAPTLVGRAGELARLRALLTSVASGRGGSAVVVGEAGLGKTTLVGALVAEADGVTVAAGACSPGAPSHLPYAPWIEILTVLDRAVPDAAVPDGVRRAVAPLLRPWEADPAEAGGLGVLFAGVTEFVVLAAAVRPVLIVVEDVHWADAATLDLLAHIARRAPRAPLVVVATSRPSDGGSGVLSELIRAATLHLPLTPLSDEDIATVVGVVRSADRGRIIRLAEGNPFLALHLATVAPDNDDVLGVRGALSDPEANRLLVRLALGGDLPDDVLATATGLPLDRRVRWSRTLVDDGLLTVRDGRLHFRHALIREEVLALATPAEIVDAHGDIADAMAATTGDDGAAALAHHQLAAGRWADGLRSSVRAADHAERVRAYRAAQDALADARTAWTRVADPSALAGMSYAELLLRLGRTARARGDFATARSVWDDLAALDHDPATVAFELALTWYFAGDEAMAVQDFERAELLLHPTSEVSRGQVLVALARALLSRHSLARALEVATAAMAATDDPDLLLNARISAAVARWLAGGPEGPAAQELRTCAREAEKRGAVDLVLRAAGNLLGVEFGANRFDEVLESVDDLTRTCAHFGPVPTLTSVVSLYRVSALRELGRWDEALAVVDRTIDDAGFRGVASGLHLFAAVIAADRGEWDDVVERIERAQAEWIDDDVLTAVLVDLRCRLALRGGNAAGAVAVLRAALADWPPSARPMATLRLHVSGWLALAAAGVGADDLAVRLDSLAASVDAGTDRVRLLREHGRAARSRAVQAPDEVVHWTTVVASLRDVGWRGELPEALLNQARALARRRHLVDAGRAAHEARAEAESIGAHVVRDEADQLLSLLGRPAPPNTPAAPEPSPMGLTPRELQVLDLLTQGATNRQIGRTLFISERTAGVHVSNIIGKLGVSNRTQAAQIGSRLGTRD